MKKNKHYLIAEHNGHAFGGPTRVLEILVLKVSNTCYLIEGIIPKSQKYWISIDSFNGQYTLLEELDFREEKLERITNESQNNQM